MDETSETGGGQSITKGRTQLHWAQYHRESAEEFWSKNTNGIMSPRLGSLNERMQAKSEVIERKKELKKGGGDTRNTSKARYGLDSAAGTKWVRWNRWRWMDALKNAVYPKHYTISIR